MKKERRKERKEARKEKKGKKEKEGKKERKIKERRATNTEKLGFFLWSCFFFLWVFWGKQQQKQ